MINTAIDNVLFKRGLMAKDKKQSKRRNSSPAHSPTSEQSKENSFGRKLLDSTISALPGMLFSLLGIIVSGIIFFTKLSVNMDNISSTMNEIKEQNKESSVLLNELNTQVAVLETQVGYLENNLDYNKPLSVKLTDDALSSISMKYVKEQNSYYLEFPVWTSDDIIGIDVDTQEEYTAAELAEQKLLFSYKNGSQDVLFYGQFDQNNLWDGTCLINVYSESNELVLIMEAVYDSGVLLEYEQAIPYITQRKEKTWIVSKRINEGTQNSGESWHYYYEDSYFKDFEASEVSVFNMLNIETFRNIVGNKLVGYYNGNTSNGLYNDNTGNAYLVKYYNNGTIRTLYKGCFKNGFFEDNTGNAWYITKEENTEYMYFKGVFKNGEADSNKKHIFENPIDYERIQEILSENNLNLLLQWELLDEL